MDQMTMMGLRGVENRERSSSRRLSYYAAHFLSIIVYTIDIDMLCRDERSSREVRQDPEWRRRP